MVYRVYGFHILGEWEKVDQLSKISAARSLVNLIKSNPNYIKVLVIVNWHNADKVILCEHCYYDMEGNIKRPRQGSHVKKLEYNRYNYQKQYQVG